MVFQSMGAPTLRGNYASIFGLDKAQTLLDVGCSLKEEGEEEESEQVDENGAVQG